MPLYDYLCFNAECGHRFEEVFSIHDDSSSTPCPRCASRGVSSIARKIITQFPGITHGLVREAHWNKTVGQVVHNDAEFKSKLSEASDRESERNGFAVNFQPIDHHDAKEHLGVTDEGMDSTYSAQVDAGQREVTKHL
jgi:putative FmdB family regulatory protein